MIEPLVLPAVPAAESFADGSLKRGLETALAAELRLEAGRLGVPLGPIESLSYALSLLRDPLSGGAELLSLREAHPNEIQPLANEGEIHDYLHLVSREMRKRLGQFVTPRPIASYILGAAGYSSDAPIEQSTLCDPACGSGVFLVEAARVLQHHLRQKGVPAAEWYPRLQANLIGLDIDPVACLYARFNLGLLLAKPLLLWREAHPNREPRPLRIYHLDTLSAIAGERGPTDWFARGRIALRERFDFVVGNPPYGKIAGLAENLKDAFADSIYGHPNLYGLFLHAGLEMVRPFGLLGFIVPRSMLSGLYFQNLRRRIEERSHLTELTLLADRKNVFDNVLQGTMILILKRHGADPPESPSRSKVKVAIVRSREEFERGPVHVEVSLSQLSLRLHATRVWFVADRARTYSMLSRLIDRHPALASAGVACAARTGQIVWNRVKPLLRQSEGRSRKPLIWATDVGRFSFRHGSAAREGRPPHLETTERTRGLLCFGSSLLVQRVTADEQPYRLVVALPDRESSLLNEGYFVENHLNLIQPENDGSSIDLCYLLGVLSSDVIDFLFRTMNGNTQVSATELNGLPIPRGSFEEEIAALARRRLQSTDAASQVDLEFEINDRVARAYGLDRIGFSFLKNRLRELRSDREATRGT